MLVTLSVAWALSLVALLSYGLLVSVELRHGVRYGRTHLRSVLDVYIGMLEGVLYRGWSHFVRYVVQLHWHYGIHTLYRSVLLFLQRVYGVIEYRFEQNRQRTKRLRAERRRATTTGGGHLEAIVAHKAASALTPAQKRALKKKSLES
jgi:hypothetical protein